MGFGMWLAHYCFHLFTSAGAIFPAAARFAADLGLGRAEWAAVWHTAGPTGDRLLILEILFLEVGMLLSLYAAYRIAVGAFSQTRRALGAFAPWGLLILGFYLLGLWILFQPMQMRGTMMMMETMR